MNEDIHTVWDSFFTPLILHKSNSKIQNTIIRVKEEWCTNKINKRSTTTTRVSSYNQYRHTHARAKKYLNWMREFLC